MAVSPIGVGTSVGFVGASDKSSKSNIEDTIKLLERKRDEYEKQNGAPADKKITDLDNRIKNLQARLDKMKSDEAEEEEDGECETCKNRRYQDESDDPGVSFKSASKLGAGTSAEAAVRGHEYEHVNRNQAKAAREGKEIVSQSVVIKRAICPECGKSYVSGGETKTVTREKRDERFDVGLNDKTEELGKLFDAVA
ncbi:MAG: hypothetical protein NC394_02625 [Bacteroides sp.]|nr:hypothetical protein [Bacteroides sp.]